MFKKHRKMAEEKKLSEEKKYAQIPKESVRCAADSVGVADLADDVASLLAEDVNYRLREVIQNCGQFMRHCKRRKLMVKDFNRALKWSDVEPVYGHSTSEPAQFHYCKEADIYYVTDKEVGLSELALSKQTFERPGPVYVKAQWLAVEGIYKGAPQGQSSVGGKRNGQVTSSVSDDLMAYYDQMTKAILGSDEELMKVALEDLRTNPKIAPALPFLINFVSIGVKKVSHDLTQLTKLLYTVSSLISNKALYLEPKPYLHLLTQGLIYCILEPLAASINPTNDHWALRDYAARLLAQIVRTWTTPVNKLCTDALSSLEEVFMDFNKPFCSHYGTVVAMIALGPEALERHLLPHVSKYWPHLSAVVDNATTFANVQVKADAQKVHGALSMAAILVMAHRTSEMLETQRQQYLATSLEMNSTGKPGGSEGPGVTLSADGENDSKPLADQVQIKLEDDSVQCDVKPYNVQRQHYRISTKDMYTMLSECFGDSLSARLPVIPFVGLYQYKPEPPVSLFSCPELLQSGEELLEAFIVKEEEWQSVSADDEHSYDDRDDNSLLSDDGEGESGAVPANVDLRIKSTVSDPTLGIKLTIAKLPRSSSTTSSNEHSGRPAKRKKLSIKIKKEHLEQAEPEKPFSSLLNMKSRLITPEFCFAGATPIPQHELKRNVIVPVFDLPFIDSEFHKLSLKAKKKAKRKTSSIKTRWRQRFATGSLFTVL